MVPEPGPVLKKIAADLALQRLPDLTGFTREQVDDEWLPLFSKSGLHPESVALLQDLVKQASLGLITMETARAQDVEGWTPERWLWTDFQRVIGLFRTETIMITMSEPRVRLMSPAAPRIEPAPSRPADQPAS